MREWLREHMKEETNEKEGNIKERKELGKGKKGEIKGRKHRRERK